jgi:hypothetical protein
LKNVRLVLFFGNTQMPELGACCGLALGSRPVIRHRVGTLSLPAKSGFRSRAPRLAGPHSDCKYRSTHCGTQFALASYGNTTIVPRVAFLGEFSGELLEDKREPESKIRGALV